MSANTKNYVSVGKKRYEMNEAAKYFESNVVGSSVNVANNLIRSKKETSLLEAKLEILGLKKLDTDCVTVEKEDSYGNRYITDSVRISADEIKLLMGRSGGSIYTEIREAAISMKQKLDIFEDPEKHQFAIKNLYGDVYYDNGILTLEYNNDASGYLYKTKSNYTKLSMPIAFAFDLHAGFQLYKNLRSYTYALKSIDMSLSQQELPEFTKSYSVEELRSTLGYINLEQSEEMKREVRKPHPNWTKVDQLDKKPMYKRWNDFKTRILEPGIDEINRISDIYVVPEYKKSGRGGRVTEIIFHVQLNKKFYEAGYVDSDGTSVIATESGAEVIEEFVPVDTKLIAEVVTMMKTNHVNPTQAEMLLNEAKGDISKVKHAYDLSKKQENIENFIGWMRAAIKRGFAEEEPIQTVYGSTAKAKQFQKLSEDRKSVQTAERVWEKAQQKEEFADFIEYIKEEYGTMEAFDVLYETAEQKFNEFAAWKTGKKQCV